MAQIGLRQAPGIGGQAAPLKWGHDGAWAGGSQRLASPSFWSAPRSDGGQHEGPASYKIWWSASTSNELEVLQESIEARLWFLSRVPERVLHQLFDGNVRATVAEVDGVYAGQVVYCDEHAAVLQYDSKERHHPPLR